MFCQVPFIQFINWNTEFNLRMAYRTKRMPNPEFLFNLMKQTFSEKISVFFLLFKDLLKVEGWYPIIYENYFCFMFYHFLGLSNSILFLLDTLIILTKKLRVALIFLSIAGTYPTLRIHWVISYWETSICSHDCHLCIQYKTGLSPFKPR